MTVFFTKPATAQSVSIPPNPLIGITSDNVEGALTEAATQATSNTDAIEAIADTDFATFYRTGVNAL